MKILIKKNISISPNDWDSFGFPDTHPANTCAFSNMHKRLLFNPVFLEAYVEGVKVSQWLLFKQRKQFNPFKIYDIFTFCAPQIINKYKDIFEEVFVEYTNFIKNTFSPQTITILNYCLIRDISENVLIKASFSDIKKYCTYICTIYEDDEETLKQFHSSHRNDTRKAIKENYAYSLNISPQEYYKLSLETYSRSNKESMPLKYLIKLENTLVKDNKAIISGVYVNEILNSASIIIYYGNRSYYLHGASASVKSRGATTYNHYENMRYLKNKGITQYDFGGGLVESDFDKKPNSIVTFKSKFGGIYSEMYGGILNCL